MCRKMKNTVGVVVVVVGVVLCSVGFTGVGAQQGFGQSKTILTPIIYPAENFIGPP